MDVGTEQEVSMCEQTGCRRKSAMEADDWQWPKPERSSGNQKIGKN